jgi:hypothetical protein
MNPIYYKVLILIAIITYCIGWAYKLPRTFQDWYILSLYYLPFWAGLGIAAILADVCK